MSKIALKTIKLGDSADTSKNFLISVPTVPDGTLTIERENGTDVLTVDASGKVSIPGNARTWQNVTASRALGGNYTNNTGVDIEVQVSVNAVAVSITMTVQGVTVIWYNGQNGRWTVPPGASYSVVASSGTLNIWNELRAA